MKPTIKRKWLAALRGKSKKKYHQAHAVLHKYRGGYCCLGVLCDVIDPKGWQLIEDDHGRMWGHGADGDCFMPPHAIRQAAGFVPGNDPCGKLSVMNDNARASFAEIADYIEENL